MRIRFPSFKPPASRRALPAALAALLLVPALGAGAYRAGVIGTGTRGRDDAGAASSAIGAASDVDSQAALNVRKRASIANSRQSPCEIGDFAVAPCDIALEVRVGEGRTVTFEASNNTSSDVPFFVWCEADAGATCSLVNPPPGNVYTLPEGTGANEIPVALSVSTTGIAPVARLHLRRDLPGEPVELVTAVTITPLPAYQYGVEVRAEDSPHETAEFSPGTFEFEVKNASTVSVPYTFATTCEGFTGACPVPSPQTLTIGAGQYGYVSVPYTAGGRGTTRTITLTATGSAPGQTLTGSDIGEINAVHHEVSVSANAATYDVDPNGAGTAWFTVTYLGNGTGAQYRLTATPSAPVVSVSSLAPIVVTRGAPYLVAVPFQAGSGFGSGAGRVSLRAYTEGFAQIYQSTAATDVRVRTHTVTVTPSGVMPATPTAGQVTSQSFQVRNDGTGTATYRFVVACPGQGAACGVSSFPDRTIAPGFANAVTLTVPYTAGAAGTTDSVRLTATSTAAAEYVQTGIAPVAVQAAPVPYGVTVFAPGGTLSVTRGATLLVDFTVRNDGPANGYRLAATCNSELYCGAVSPDTVSLGAGPSTTLVRVTVRGAVGTGTAPGTVTLTATSANTQSRSATANVTVSGSSHPGSVAVRPDTGRVFTNVPTSLVKDSVAFYVRNGAVAGTGSVTYTLSRACAGVAQQCELSGGATVVVAPQDSQRVFVRFTPASAVGDSGRVTLTASGANVEDQGTIGVIGKRLLETAAFNPGSTLERDACVSVAVNRAAAYECGDLRLAHALPSVTTRGRTRTPTLVYQSAHARPFPVVRAEVMLRPGVPQTDSVAVTLTVPGVTPRTRRLHRDAWAPVLGGSPAGAERRIALGFDGVALATGLYPYAVTVDYGGGTRWTTAGEVIVVNRSQSPFGAGWWLAGYERLYKVDGTNLTNASRLLWVGGDGGARVYARDMTVVGANALFRAERPYDRPDSLTRFADGSFARWLPGNGGVAWVRFDYEGHHVHTRDRLSQHTYFDHDTQLPRDAESRFRLGGLRVPPHTSDLRYAFAYGNAVASGNARLSGVTLFHGGPGNEQPRRAVAVENATGTVIAITDPDGRQALFGYGADGTPANLVTTRADKRGTQQRFRYDGAFRLASASVTVPGAGINGGPQEVAHTFCAAEVQGLAGCKPDAVDPVFLATSWNGPRTNATPNDVTYFSVDRFGAPRRIQNAFDSATTVQREHARFPGLVTRVIDFSGFERRAGYDTLGRLLVDTAFSPTAGVPQAITRYAWDAKWEEPTEVTSAEGVVTSFGYDATTGNRRWQQSGPATPVSSDRVTFAYYDAPAAAGSYGQLQTVTYPAVSGSPAAREELEYTPLGNVWQVTQRSDTAARAATRYGYDALGLGQLTATAVLVRGPRDTGAWQETQRYPDVMGRDSITVTYAAPIDSGQTPPWVGLTQLRDGEGNVVTAIRSQSPDPRNIGPLTTRWEYDALGRATVEIAPDSTPDVTADNPRERRYYDEAGNVDSVVTRRGDRIAMKYDALNRLAERATRPFCYPTRRVGIALRDQSLGEPAYPLHPSGVAGCSGYHIPGDVEKLTYDAMGRVLTARNMYARTARTYHANGLLATEEQRVRRVDGAGADSGFARPSYLLTYGYDKDGRRRTLGLPPALAAGTNGNIGYAYDYAKRGELQAVTDALGASFSFTYTHRGELAQLGLPGNIRQWLHYDGLGQLIRDSVVNSGGTTGFRPPARLLRNVTREYDDLRGKLTRGADAVLRQTTRDLTYTGLGHVRSSVTSERQGVETFTSTETLAHDALGNRTQLGVDASWSINGYAQVKRHTRAAEYEVGTGRLSRETVAGTQGAAFDPVTRLTHSLNGDVEVSATAAPRADVAAEDRVSYYAPDGRVRLSEFRNLSGIQGGLTRPMRRVFEEYWHDALGRRVLVRTRRECALEHRPDPPLNAAQGRVLCELATVRRTVWDGDHELVEVQMPDVAADDLRENDTAPVKLPLRNFDNQTADPNPFFGRVLYTHGAGVDRPLSLTRINYVTGAANPANAVVAPPGSWAPHWDDRDMPPYGTFAHGAQAGNERCAAPCMGSPALPLGWFVYDLPALSERLAWYGTVVDSKRDAAGTLYRRNRAYDPATGRFTQEDPIGLAGGVNLYGFAGGDPANFSDPFGLCPVRLGGDGRTTALWDCPEGSSGFRMFHGANIASTDAPWELGSRSLFSGGIRGAVLSLTGRAARREAMRRRGIPTSRPFDRETRPRAHPDDRQYEYDAADGGVDVVTHHSRDEDHPKSHWEAGRAKQPVRTDPLGRKRYGNDKSKVQYP